MATFTIQTKDKDGNVTTKVVDTDESYKEQYTAQKEAKK